MGAKIHFTNFLHGGMNNPDKLLNPLCLRVHLELQASTLFLSELIGTCIFDDKVQATFLDLKKKLLADTEINSFLEDRFFNLVSRIKADNSNSTLNR